LKVTGGKLKESGTANWISPNTGATNAIEFSAFQGGWRDFNGKFSSIGNYCGWWFSSIEHGNNTHALQRHILNNNMAIINNYYDKAAGFSVRLIKD
jgi:uncharacterized protein (TIGR02145 family)